MTPREVAHRDILTAYRRARALCPVPADAMVRVQAGYALMLADDMAQGDSSDEGWIERFKICQEYLDGMVHRPDYWVLPQYVSTRKPIVGIAHLTIRETGTGWPV